MASLGTYDSGVNMSSQSGILYLANRGILVWKIIGSSCGEYYSQIIANRKLNIKYHSQCVMMKHLILVTPGYPGNFPYKTKLLETIKNAMAFPSWKPKPFLLHLASKIDKTKTSEIEQIQMPEKGFFWHFVTKRTPTRIAFMEVLQTVQKN